MYLFLYFSPCCMFIRDSHLGNPLFYQVGQSVLRLALHRALRPEFQIILYIADQKTHQFDFFRKILVILQVMIWQR